ncbi:eukaryotic rRNA processing protein EBP2-domain-containing protein [Armillaria mellea]|nr:eukaryotic rRNA processing protein EBP2-domain-containing protein [Armillaria mellea]
MTRCLSLLAYGGDPKIWPFLFFGFPQIRISMASSKSKTPEKRTKGKVIAAPIVVPAESSDSNDEDSDNGGVDEAGMERLMKALGDKGLDEFDQAQLGALGGDDESDSEGENEDGSDEEVEGLQENDSEEDEEEEQEAGEDDGDDGEEDIALEDVEDVDDDVVPRQKIEIDNHAALVRIRESIQLDTSLPWTETLVLSYPETIDVDVNDDLNREVAFYKQALHGANAGRTLAAKHKFPFTRPADYFAEMVKTDAHMERIRQRLLDESSGIKKSEDKRKEREGKKFGKQVQIEKLKERERSKKDMEERLKGLKRKRKDVLDNPNAEDDAFDVAVEDAISDRPAKRGRGGGGGGLSRQSRDKKFGFGGGDRRSKQNTRESTDNFEAGSRKGSFRGGRGGRGGGRGGRGVGAGRGGGSSGGRHSSKRLGKSRRITARSKT